MTAAMRKLVGMPLSLSVFLMWSCAFAPLALCDDEASATVPKTSQVTKDSTDLKDPNASKDSKDPDPDEIRSHVLETMPPKILEKLEKLQNSEEVSKIKTRYFLEKSKLWPSGYTIKVAFNGGSPSAHAVIAQVADEWTNYGNILFDFGYNPKTRQYRTWSTSDKEYSADIRIGFDGRGYWSVVGTDCQNPSMAAPDEKSMNLSLRGFDASEFYTAVLHEFGHALGFKHEHQRPATHCDAQMRWDDDDGYEPTRDADGCYLPDSKGRRPGIYTWSSGAPNFWSRARAEAQMKSMPFSSAFQMGPDDPQSIMRYHHPAFFYKDGSKSPCFTRSDGGLSKLDKQGMSKAYPFKL